MTRVLLVEDDPGISVPLTRALRREGYTVDVRSDGESALEAARARPDLIVLDLGLPDMDGKKVVAAIRDWSLAPIIVLSARDQEQEKIEALDAGADDYVTKPFSVGELMARIRVSLRRSTVPEHEPVLQCGDLTVDLVQRRVSVGTREIKLTPTEYELLKILAQYRGRVVTHKQLLKSVWGNNYDEDTHYIRVYIGQLRRKIEENPTQPRYIVTESGIGYRMMG